VLSFSKDLHLHDGGCSADKVRRPSFDVSNVGFAKKGVQINLNRLGLILGVQEALLLASDSSYTRVGWDCRSNCRIVGHKAYRAKLAAER
jgi:hypothetical protein